MLPMYYKAIKENDIEKSEIIIYYNDINSFDVKYNWVMYTMVILHYIFEKLWAVINFSLVIRFNILGQPLNLTKQILIGNLQY